MGQRLNIEIVENEETLANAYYHWSAYTSSALHLTQMILEKMEQIQHEQPVIRAVRLLETTGALLTHKEIESATRLESNAEFQQATNRNDGLIAITLNGIEETRSWEEGRVEIDLTNKSVRFDVWWIYDKKSYLEEYEVSESDYEKMLIQSFDVDQIPFSEFNQFANELIKNIEEKHYQLRLRDDQVLCFIE